MKPFDVLANGGKTGDWLLRLDSEPLAPSVSEVPRFPTDSLGCQLAPQARSWLLRLDSNQQPSG
jgi:hypothetical protein